MMMFEVFGAFGLERGGQGGVKEGIIRSMGLVIG